MASDPVRARVWVRSKKWSDVSAGSQPSQASNDSTDKPCDEPETVTSRNSVTPFINRRFAAKTSQKQARCTRRGVEGRCAARGVPGGARPVQPPFCWSALVMANRNRNRNRNETAAGTNRARRTTAVPRPGAASSTCPRRSSSPTAQDSSLPRRSFSAPPGRTGETGQTETRARAAPTRSNAVSDRNFFFR